MKWKKEAKVLFLEAVPGTALPDVLVRQLKESKDIDPLVIAFFAFTLKIVSSLFHTQPCLQGDKFSDHDWVMILIRIIKGYLYSNGVGRSHGEQQWSCWLTGELKAVAQPQRPSTSGNPSETLDVLQVAFHCSLYMYSRVLRSCSLYGSFLLCTSVFVPFILAVLYTKAASQISYSRDVLNFSLLPMPHFQLGFPAIRQLEAYFPVPAVPVIHQRLNF